MTVIKAMQKLSKLGEVKKDRVYFLRIGNISLNFFDNGGSGDAICYHMNHYNEEGEIYHTTYFDNITQMIKFATR